MSVCVCVCVRACVCVCVRVCVWFTHVFVYVTFIVCVVGRSGGGAGSESWESN
jgi:hypothetical protein